MLFNSHVFLFAFLPIVLLVFHVLGKRDQTHLARLWLVAASLFFYAWWNPRYLPLIVGSVVANYAIGVWLATTSASALFSAGSPPTASPAATAKALVVDTFMKTELVKIAATGVAIIKV